MIQKLRSRREQIRKQTYQKQLNQIFSIKRKRIIFMEQESTELKSQYEIYSLDYECQSDQEEKKVNIGIPFMQIKSISLDNSFEDNEFKFKCSQIKQDFQQLIYPEPQIMHKKMPTKIKQITFIRQMDNIIIGTKKNQKQETKNNKLELKKPNQQKVKVGNKYYYNPLELLGEGSNGKVYKGYQVNNSENTVAIKRIRINSLHKEKILREIEVHSKLNSPYIVQLYDYYITEDYCYLILELCDEGTLADKVNKSKLPVQDSLRYFQQLLKGVQLLWNQQIIHRDLKLENILLKNNTIKIADFGFAKIVDDKNLSCNSMKCGTPSTMAPEIYLANSNQQIHYNQKQDIWALGVILHELIYKQHPFYLNAKRLIDNQRVKVVPIDSIIEDFINKSLQPKMHLRMSAEQCINHQINFHLIQENRYQCQELTQNQNKILNPPKFQIQKMDQMNQTQETEKTKKSQNLLQLGIFIIYCFVILYFYYQIRKVWK